MFVVVVRFKDQGIMYVIDNWKWNYKTSNQPTVNEEFLIWKW